jgi:G3E family GTPase
MVKVKIDIISGFLGAGKTTLIKKLLEEELYKERIVLIENEFGEVGIDGDILSQSSIQVKDIISGCICCTLVGDFIKAIKEVVSKFNPDRIIIEPSGVARLSDVIRAIGNHEITDIIEINMVAAVVDVTNYHLYSENFGEFFMDQIIHARTIVLSRTQDADPKTVGRVMTGIRTVNGKANIISTPWQDISAQHIIEVGEQKPDEQTFIESHGSCDHGTCHHSLEDHCNLSHNGSESQSCHTGHQGDEVFDAWGTETAKTYYEDALRDILYKLDRDKQYGVILRAKGIVQHNDGSWLQFDYVPGQVSIKKVNPYYTGKLCVIGTGLRKDGIAALFDVQ